MANRIRSGAALGALVIMGLSGCGNEGKKPVGGPAPSGVPVATTAAASAVAKVARYRVVGDLCAVVDVSAVGDAGKATVTPSGSGDTGRSCTIKFPGATPSDAVQVNVIVNIATDGYPMEGTYNSSMAAVTVKQPVAAVGTAATYDPGGVLGPQLFSWDANAAVIVQYASLNPKVVPADLRERLSRLTNALYVKLGAQG